MADPQMPTLSDAGVPVLSPPTLAEVAVSSRHGVILRLAPGSCPPGGGTAPWEALQSVRVAQEAQAPPGRA